MTRKDSYELFLAHFSEAMPVAETELEYSNPFELLVAVSLSAQCTDKRVNSVMPALIKAFPDAKTMAKTTAEKVFPFIKSISYPNNKAKNLVGMAQTLLKEFKGVVPSEIEQLVMLPGVGRKTANVIASVIYEKPAMAVDTHVFRVSKRIGLVTQTASTTLAVEKQLVKHLPENVIHKEHHWLILHGRYVCTARNPKCVNCALMYSCRHYGRSNSKINKS